MLLNARGWKGVAITRARAAGCIVGLASTACLLPALEFPHLNLGMLAATPALSLQDFSLSVHYSQGEQKEAGKWADPDDEELQGFRRRR